jgi:ethanolamine ammonia-lyase large subunit
MSSTRSGSRQRRSSLTSAGKPVNSPTSSTASVSVAALDDQVSLVSSFGKSRAQNFFAFESGHVAELNSDGCKENVTVTVRFRPLRFLLWINFFFQFV